MRYTQVVNVDRLRRLARLAEQIHADDRDLQGEPYMRHVHAVTSNVSEQAMPIALFHDALEDHPDSYRDVAKALDTTELAAVILITRLPGEKYADYIERIAAHPGAVGALVREVKLADLHHNLGRLPPSLARLRPRYESAIARLTG